MNQLEHFRTYLEALAFHVFPTKSTESTNRMVDDRGMTMEQIVIIGAAAVGAALVAGILWTTLQEGADKVEVPVP